MSWIGNLFMPFKAWYRILGTMNKTLLDRLHDDKIKPKDMWNLKPILKEFSVKRDKPKKSTDNNGKNNHNNKIGFYR